MHKTHISATDLKKRVSTILNDVYFGGNIAVIERYGKAVAEIVPLTGATKNVGKNLDKVLDKYFGALPDFPDVTKYRRSRRKKFSLSL